MATYTETIELRDMVSGPAKAAADSMSLVGKGISAVNRALVKVGPVASAAIAPVSQLADAFARMADALARIAGFGPIRIPKAPGDTKPPGSSAPKSLPAPTGQAAPTVVSPVARPAAPTLVSPVQPVPVAGKAPIMPALPPVKVPVIVDTVSAVAQFKTLTSAIKSGESAMTKAAALGDKAGFDKAAAKVGELKGALDKLPAGTATAATGAATLSKSLWNARNAMDVGRQTIEAGINGIKNAFSSLAKGDIKGAIAGVTESIAGMSKMLDMVVPGLGQVVSAVVSIAGGLVGLTAGLVVAGAKFAVFASQSKQAMISSFDAMGGGIVTGIELDDMLSSLSDRLGITKDQLVPLTQAFLQMGVTSVDALENLTAAAMSAEAITKGGAAAFTDLQKKIQLAVETGQGFKLGEKQLLNLRAAGIGVSDMAVKMGMTTDALTASLKAGTVDAKAFGEAMTEAVTKKGAGPLLRMSASFEAVRARFDQAIGDMFEDIDVGPFMAQVKSLFSIFDASTESGKAMKAGIGGFFKEVFETATKVVPVVRNFLLDMVIYGQKAYLAILPIEMAIKKFFASATGGAMLSVVLDALWMALKGIAIVVAVIVGGFALFVAWIGICVAAGAALVAQLVFVATTLSGIVQVAISNMVASWGELATTAIRLGTDFVTGLVNGITAGASAVANAVKGVAGGAVDAFTNFLKIGSPSKVMMGLGAFTSEGFATGLEDGGPDVHGAASSVAGMAVAGASDGVSASAGGGGAAAASAAAAAPAGGGGGGQGLTWTGDLVINGASKDVQAISQEAVAALLEQFALQAGL